MYHYSDYFTQIQSDELGAVSYHETVSWDEMDYDYPHDMES